MSDSTPERALRILVAEDTEVIAFMMMEILSRAGYEVALARDGAACLSMVDEFQPDLLLLDLMMPQVHGVEVMKRLRGRKRTRDLGSSSARPSPSRRSTRWPPSGAPPTT